MQRKGEAAKCLVYERASRISQHPGRRANSIQLKRRPQSMFINKGGVFTRPSTSLVNLRKYPSFQTTHVSRRSRDRDSSAKIRASMLVPKSPRCIVYFFRLGMGGELSLEGECERVQPRTDSLDHPCRTSSFMSWVV